MTDTDQSAFISYSREDSEFALRLAGDLRDAGAAIWFDQADILAGEHWDKAVERALVRCPRMLLILSPTSVGSVNVNDEVSFALEKGKIVLPILYRTCEIPFRIRRLQYTDFRTDYARALKTLLGALSSIPPKTDRPPDTPHPAVTTKSFTQRLTVRVGIAASTVAIVLIGILAIHSFSRQGPDKVTRTAASSSTTNSSPPAIVITAQEAAPTPGVSTSAPGGEAKIPVHKPASLPGSNTSAPVAKPKTASTEGSPKSKEELAAAEADELWRINRYQEARPGLEAACNAGIVRSCTFLGSMYDYGSGVVRDQRRAIALYAKSCDGGYMTGCFTLGSTYAHGDPELRDYPKAIAALQKGCDGRDRSSCFELGQLFRAGTNVTHDINRAVTDYRRGCDLEDMPSCYNLGLVYQEGAGVTENLEVAVDLYRKACKGGIVPACTELVQFYEQGKGTPADRTQAAMVYRKACELGLAEACTSLKNLAP